MGVFVFVGMCAYLCFVMSLEIWKLVSDLFSEDHKG